MMDNTAHKARKLIEQSQKIALIGHINPDGDCIGSMLGLGRVLHQQGKSVSYFTPSKPSKIYNFLPDFDKISDKFDYVDYDLIILVDLSGYDRISPFDQDKAYFDNKAILIFDHHPSDTPSHAIAHKDVHSMSTAELILEFIEKQRPESIDRQTATYLYLGLMSDSGNFLFGNDHVRIFTNALTLLKLGADRTSINNNIIRQKSLQQIQFLGLLIQRMHIQGKVLYSYYQEKELQAYGIDEEEAGYGLVVIQNIQGPGLTLILKKFDHHIKGSLRSKQIEEHSKAIDCNSIAKHFGGGGHPEAAGFSIPAQGVFSKQITDIINQINTMLEA